MSTIDPNTKPKATSALSATSAATAGAKPAKSDGKKPAVDLETVPAGPKPDVAAFYARATTPKPSSEPASTVQGIAGGSAPKKATVRVGEVLSDPGVQAELARAWMDTLHDINDPAPPPPGAGAQEDPKEEGGWVYAARNPGLSGKFVVVRAPRSVRGGEIDLGKPPVMPGFDPVATFHTHPISGMPSQTLGPSAADVAIAWERGLPGIVVGMGGSLPYGPKAPR